MKKLTDEMKGALGSMSGLIPRYEVLLEKSNKESLRDHPQAISYVEDVIKRFQFIRRVHSTDPELQVKKEHTCSQLKEHIKDLCVLFSSKPETVAGWLKDMGFENDVINEVAKGVEQPGGADEELFCCVATVATSETSLICCDANQHSHPYAYRQTTPYPAHHHGHPGGPGYFDRSPNTHVHTHTHTNTHTHTHPSGPFAGNFHGHG